jgi:hypothetical protein
MGLRTPYLAARHAGIVSPIAGFMRSRGSIRALPLLFLFLHFPVISLKSDPDPLVSYGPGNRTQDGLISVDGFRRAILIAVTVGSFPAPLL